MEAEVFNKLMDELHRIRCIDKEPVKIRVSPKLYKQLAELPPDYCYLEHFDGVVNRKFLGVPLERSGDVDTFEIVYC